MMVNLFSVFDPSVSVLNLSWTSFFIFTFLLGTFFLLFNFFVVFFSLICSFLYSELLSLTKGKAKGFFYVLGLFSFVFFSNFFSLFPLVFPMTSHLCIVFPLAFCFWLFSFLFGFFRRSFLFFGSVVPFGTPPFLMGFMVLVELISSLIRPVTLSVRLVANITAGHLLLTILVKFCLVSFFGFFVVFFVVLLMSILEFAVSLIQSYVFMVLVVMYLSDY